MIYFPKSTRGDGSGWRAYQRRLQRDRRVTLRGRRGRQGLKAMAVLTALVVAGYLLITGSVGSHPYLDSRSETAGAPAKAEPGKTPENGQSRRQAQPAFGKSDLRRMIDNERLSRMQGRILEIQHQSRPLTVVTTIDPGLQQYLRSKLDLRHSRYIGIVAMDPETGRVRALVGFNKLDPASNPCIDGSYPAASIFKIITAAAAVENGGLQPESPLYFNGRKHTLYKSQLTDAANKYSTWTTLKDSFAQSVNPVFGKLGASELGKKILSEYARAFGFDRDIDLCLPVAPSRIEIANEPYQWAEVASGFNNDTTMSPIHAAMVAAAILNGGRLMAPAIVERITDEQGRAVYQNRPEVLGQAVLPKTTKAMRALMETTIRSGTARRPFRRAQRDKVLSGLIFGGKTGSINSRANDVRYDWFVGYAAQKDGRDRLAIAVMVAHEDYIGTRAADYARLAFKEYFGSPARGAGMASLADRGAE